MFEYLITSLGRYVCGRREDSPFTLPQINDTVGLLEAMASTIDTTNTGDGISFQELGVRLTDSIEDRPACINLKGEKLNGEEGRREQPYLRHQLYVRAVSEMHLKFLV